MIFSLESGSYLEKSDDRISRSTSLSSLLVPAGSEPYKMAWSTETYFCRRPRYCLISGVIVV